MGKRSNGSWRYRVMKHYLHRVQKFKMDSGTLAEREAWNKVETWFKSVLEHRQYDWKTRVIKLPKIALEEIK